MDIVEEIRLEATDRINKYQSETKKKWHDRKVRLKDKELVNLVLQRVAVRDRYPLGPHGADQSMGRLRA